MLTEDQEKRINTLYVEYQEDIKPLMFYVERSYHKFPKALLKEFRDVFDHISRCYEKDVSDEYKNDNLMKAENHFCRIKLDTYKYVSDYKKREFTRWKRKYNKYDLQSITDGELWKTIIELEDDGEKLFTEARHIESKDVVKSCERLQESILKYDSISELIKNEKNCRLIRRAKFKYRKISFINGVIGFAVGVCGSIFATWLWEIFQKK